MKRFFYSVQSSNNPIFIHKLYVMRHIIYSDTEKSLWLCDTATYGKIEVISWKVI